MLVSSLTHLHCSTGFTACVIKLTIRMCSAGALGSVMVHGPAVCEHCIATAQLQPGRKPKREPLSEPELAALFKAVQEWEAWLSACETSAPEGFIAARSTGMQSLMSLY